MRWEKLSWQLPYWLGSEFIKMASVTRFIRGHFSPYNEVGQFWSHCITLTSWKYLFTTKSLPNLSYYKKPCFGQFFIQMYLVAIFEFCKRNLSNYNGTFHLLSRQFYRRWNNIFIKQYFRPYLLISVQNYFMTWFFHEIFDAKARLVF